MSPPQDLEQDEIYVSSREGPIEVKWMVTTHARRALDALVREHGVKVFRTPLGLALLERAYREGTATEIDSIDGKSKMIRGPRGRFIGAWRKP